MPLALGAAVASAVYVRWVRPWELRWGADEDEVAMRAPGDELVESPNLVATQAITVDAPPESVWPWLVQIGSGRAGWYSYDRLDNKGRPRAWQIIPEFQHMEVCDVVAMSEQKGEPYGPSGRALDAPQSMVWGDVDEPHGFTWLWLLRDGADGQTRLISRIRCRLSWHDPVFALMMELADPTMMRRTLLSIRERAEILAGQEAGQEAGSASAGGDRTQCGS